MPEGTAVVSFGAALKIETSAGSATYSELPNCSDFDFGGSWSVTDITSHNSGASVPVTSKKKTMLDNGTLSFTLRVDKSKATHVQLFSLYRSTASWNFQFINADPSEQTRTFAGLVSQWQESDPTDGVVEASVQIDITGDITYS